MSKLTNVSSEFTIGMDVGDRSSEVCVLDAAGKVVRRRGIPTTPSGMFEFFSGVPSSPVAFEVGTHSPWIWELLEKLRHEPVVANPRQVALIARSQRKTDRYDAELLARLLRADRELLRPIRHRRRETRRHLALLRTRCQLVRTRTSLVGRVRGLLKSFGERLPGMDAAVFHRRAAERIPPDLLPAVQPLLAVLASVAEQIDGLEKEITRLCEEEYPETKLLRQVPRVGEITALTYVLTLEDAGRFSRSEDVGAYLGLVPRKAESGQRSPELPISKAGDRELRRLLVQCSQQILGKRGPDSDLKQWGLELARRGKKKAKRRAVVGVARKLAVLLHRLWVTGEEYEPRRRVA